LISGGLCHQVGDTLIHVPKGRVVFAGDVMFPQCAPVGWVGIRRLDVMRKFCTIR
jgi:cyclase